MSGIFNASIFNNSIFNTGAAGPSVVEEVVKTGTGGITKPFPIRRKTLHLKKPNIELKERLDKQIEDEIQITRRLSEEFTSEVSRETFPDRQLSLHEIEHEIGVILQKKLRTDEDEVLLLLLLAAGNV